MMIGKLTGRLEYKALDHVLIDVRGVGYLVYCSERTLSALPPVGEMTALYTDLVVREDLLQLFGFTSLVEKEWHKLLTSVQGVGAKASLAILGTLGPEGVGRAIALGDWNSVKAAKGIGPKIAQRVVQELKDKAPQVMAMGSTPDAQPSAEEVSFVEQDTPRASKVLAQPTSISSSATSQAEALSALANLGYAPSDAARAVAQAAQDTEATDTANLIRTALKLLAPTA